MDAINKNELLLNLMISSTRYTQEWKNKIKSLLLQTINETYKNTYDLNTSIFHKAVPATDENHVEINLEMFSQIMEKAKYDQDLIKYCEELLTKLFN